MLYMHNSEFSSSLVSTIIKKINHSVLIFPFIFCLLLFTTCEHPYSFIELLDAAPDQAQEDQGNNSAPLEIYPSQTSIYIGSYTSFYASGGVPSYTYSLVEGSGSVTEEGGYNAGDSAGTAILRVTDSGGETADAVVTITDQQLNADYIVDSISNSPASTESGSVLSQSFTYTNQGSESGSQNVYWNAYISTDQELDGGDDLIDTGQSTSLSFSDTSDTITFDGSWPLSSGIYYLIVKVSSGDDTDPSNNTGVSGAFNVTAGLSDIDYVVSDITQIYPTVSSYSLCSETFDLSNTGGADGTETISWTAYASTNLTIDGSDTVIDSDITSLGGLVSGGSHENIPISGHWPIDVGNYFLLIEISSDDETVTDNNIVSRGGYSVVSAPDYNITSVNYLNSGNPLNPFGVGFDFIISEIDNKDGNQPINWEVYISVDTFLDENDDLVLEGIAPALSLNDSTDPISFKTAEWPDMGSYYYIIINISSGDDSDSTNNTYFSPDTVYVAETHTEESEDNSGTGPVVNDGDTISPVTNLTDSLYGGDLNPDQTLEVQGFMDDLGGIDTYKIITDLSLSKMELYVTWNTTFDDINFKIWDEFKGEYISDDLGADNEPFTPALLKYGIVGGRTYYISVEFMRSGMVDTDYSIIITGK
jgi:hypothetical protein